MIAPGDMAAILAEHCAGPAFGIPGGGKTLQVIDALEARGFSFVRTHFEGSAALMAGAIGRLRQKPGLCFSIKGPGFANLAAGLAGCRLDALPVVAVTEAYDNVTPAAMQHKRIDQLGIAQSVSKLRVSQDSDLGVLTGLAGQALAEPQGPVLLELAASGPDMVFAHTVAPSGDRAAGLMLVERAKRPVVICGNLGLRDGVRSQLQQLEIPVFTTASAKGAVDEHRAYCAGVFTGVGQEFAPETRVLAEADLVIGIGLRAAEILSFGNIRCPRLLLDTMAADDPGQFEVQLALDSLPQVVACLSGKAWGRDLVEASLRDMRQRLLQMPFLPAHAYDIMEAELPAGFRLVLDTGYFCTVGEHMVRIDRPENYLSSAMARSMGASLPMAVGAALLEPEKPTVLVVGDGGIGMFFAELKLAVEAGANLLVVLMSDGAFGSIRAAARKSALTETPLRISNPTWRANCEALGLWTAAAQDANGIRKAVQEWARRRGPGLIELQFEADAYRDMTVGLRP